GALVSQLASTRRLALELGTAVLAVAFVLRVIADTASSLGWMRWLTPLGWGEEVRPFTDPQPAVFLLMGGVAAVLIALAWRIAQGRDIGEGMLRSRDSREPNLALLSSPTAQAFRDERRPLPLWPLP